MHLTNFLQLFPVYYWVLILMVIADTCEYCVQFITTSNYVHSAHGCYNRLLFSSAQVILGFWWLFFPPWWFPSASHCVVLGLEAAVPCDLSGRPPALPQQCWAQSPGCSLALGAVLAPELLEEELPFQQELWPPAVFVRHFIGKILNTFFCRSHILLGRMVHKSFWCNCQLRFTLFISELGTGLFIATALLCVHFRTSIFAIWGFSH